MTLEETILEKLRDIESKLKLIELKDALRDSFGSGERPVPLTAAIYLIEDVAQKCPVFQGFTITKNVTGKQDDIGNFVPETLTIIQCSCKSIEHGVILCGDIPEIPLKKYIDEITLKYKKPQEPKHKKPQEPKPKMQHPIERIDL